LFVERCNLQANSATRRSQPPAAGVGDPSLGQLRLQSPIKIASKSWFAASAESGSKVMLPGWQVPAQINQRAP
jgi:hypothetical protein